VIQQWDEILRMIATIKLKEVTASDLFRRLNSYSILGRKAAGQRRDPAPKIGG
jgi:TnpA family transposase